MAQVDTSREDQLLRTALDYIETNRKGTLQMQFVDSMTGSYVSDAEVQYQQISHDFMFSTHFVYDPAKMQSAGLEWSGDVSLSWAEIEPSRGVYDFSKPNTAIRWLRGYYTCLYNWTSPACTAGYKQVRLWAQFRSLLPDSQYPEAPRPPDFADFDHIADSAVFAHYKDLVYEFVSKVATVYRGKISAYVTQPGINWPSQAVVAGLSKESTWTIQQAIELNKVVTKAIREADPDAIIILGASTPWKGASESDVDALRFAKLCLDAGVDVDTVALEAWPSDGTPSFFYDYVKKLAQLGKRIFIKETGYPSEEPTGVNSWLKNGKWKVFDENVQALWFRYMFTFTFGMKETAGVGLNVFRDNADWSVGVFRTTWEPKESAAMLRGLMSNFTTSGTGRTDGNGVLVLRGFAGDYTVQVRGCEPVVVHVSEGQIRKLAVKASSSSIRPIEVDFSKTVGKIRSLSGVHDVVSEIPLLVPFPEQCRNIGVDYVRTFTTYAAYDIDIVFPDFQADPAKESSYNFTSTDREIQAIMSVGAQVLYTLGYGWRVPAPMPPNDYAKFAEICEHIVMHYNLGWAKGFHYGIQYWEACGGMCEPDYPNFWRGTPEQYFTLYDTIARAVKSADPETKVGGPALALNMTFLEKFLQSCRAKRSPLDFVSWHIYSDAPPHLMAETARHVQDLLETYGYGNVESLITEWNSCLPPCDWKARGAAWAASGLIYLQNTSVSRAFRFGSTNIQFDKTANAFLAMKNMLQSPVRLACNGSDSLGFATLAGKSGNGDIVRVMISDFDAEYDEFMLTVNGLPWQGKTIVVEIYLSDDTHDMALIDRFEQIQSGSLVIRHTISPSSIYLISLQTKEPSAKSATRSETIWPQTSLELIAQSLLPLSAALVVVSVAVISYMFKKRRRPAQGSHRWTA
jgi:hypothetical protein